MAAVEGQSDVRKGLLHLATSVYNLSESHPLDVAVAVYPYTLNDPHIYADMDRELCTYVCTYTCLHIYADMDRELCNPDCRKHKS